MFHNSNFIKLIKAANRRGNLSAINDDSDYFYVTEEHVIAKVPKINFKLTAAITECLGLINKSEAKGKVSKDGIFRIWEKLTAEATEEAVFTRWIYYGYQETDIYVFKAAGRLIRISCEFLDILEHPEECDFKVHPQNYVVASSAGDPFLLISPFYDEKALPVHLLQIS